VVGGKVGAFVALYADPSRARELLPAIRRRARHTDATVERVGHATIVWISEPDAAVARCARHARP
jgi:hypothetical protein